MSSVDSEHETGVDGAVRPSDAETGADPTAAFYRPAADSTEDYHAGVPGPGTDGGWFAGLEHNEGNVKGSWWRHWTWMKALGVVGATFAVFILLHAGAHFYEHHAHMPATTIADLSSIGCG